MRVPTVGGVVARARSELAQAPARLQGFSGAGLRRRVRCGDFRDREILAWRPYGFGSRMGELLNAMRVATALDARFVFHWPAEPLFDVGDAQSVFAPEFLERHHLDALDISQFGELKTAILPSDVRCLRRSSLRGARMRERYQVRTTGVGLDLPSFGEAFSRVAFCERLEEIRSQVYRGEPFDLVIHFRRPDLLVPESRFGGVFASKMVPLSLLKAQVSGLRQGGARRIAVLGNDAEEVEAVAAEMGIIAPNDVVALDRGQREDEAFRDFCLMSRSRSVVGGWSAFARVAQLIAGSSEVIQPDQVFSAADARALLWEAAMNTGSTDRVEATLASDHLFQRQDIVLTQAEEILLLERTVELDPDDPTRWLGLIARYARSGDQVGADRALDRFSRQFADRVPVAVELARRSTTPEHRPGHLTARDWPTLQSLMAGAFGRA